MEDLIQILSAAGKGASLLQLAIISNPSLGELGTCTAPPGQRALGEVMQRMGLLTSLTSLTLASCSLPALPPPLSTLMQLRHLDLNSNSLGASCIQEAQVGRFSTEPIGVLAPVGSFTCLTRLDLGRNPGLRCLPPQLSALSALQSLELAESLSGLGTPASCEAACVPLRYCTALTYLGLRACMLPSLPSHISMLLLLREVDLRHNPALLMEDQLLCLSDLPSLCVVDLNSPMPGCKVPLSRVRCLQQKGVQVLGV